LAQPGVNYPDILGYITGGARYNAGVAQVALAVRPRVVRAGRPFEAILLIQNASDAEVDVTAVLQIPQQDAKKKPNRFIARSTRLVVGLRPAEVGYVVLPVNCLPDTAISDGYKIGMSIEVKAVGKPGRIRASDGGGTVTLEYLTDKTLTQMDALKKLTYSTSRRGLMGAVLEAPFNVLSAQIGQMVDLKAEWVSLWRMSDYRDDRLLMEQYGRVIAEQVLPRLKREALYPPLLERTQRQFAESGYALEAAEAHYITKLLVLLLEMAAPEEDTYDYLGDDFYNVSLLFKRGLPEGGEALTLPSWCKGMLKAIEGNAHAAERPADVLAGDGYDELLRDAIHHGLHMVARATGEDMGSEQDIHEYAERLIGRIRSGKPTLTFDDVYLPLVLGGIIVYDRVILANEKVGEQLTELSRVIKSRYAEIDGDAAIVYRMVEQVLDRTFQKYGYRA